jgi:hypothetical protein
MYWAPILALVAAVLIDHFNFLIRSIGYPLAAILAIYGMSVFIDGTPLAGWLIARGDDIAEWLGSVVVPILGAATGSAISRYLLAVIVVITAAFWFIAMIPPLTKRLLGEAATREMNSALIWGGAFILIIGGALVPGTTGDAIRGMTHLGISTGGGIAGWVS